MMKNRLNVVFAGSVLLLYCCRCVQGIIFFFLLEVVVIIMFCIQELC